MLAGDREDAELDAEVARVQAEIEDELQQEAEGDFPAKFAQPSRPHREDGEEDDEEVRHRLLLVVSSRLTSCELLAHR